ncbi:MAG TPA: FtsX-like permease family protein [Terriglobia bacterium]|nr:FtsX-like permease family protein [Terriglobia bacterium]
MGRHLPLILKNSWRNTRRTVLTVVSIGVSLCLLGVLMAIYHAFFFSTPSPGQELRLVTRNRVSLAFPMPQSYGANIKAIPGVREVEIEQWYGGKYIDDHPEHMFARMAVEPDKFFTIYPDVKIPDEQKKAFQQERTACIAGKELAQKLHWNLGDRITIQGDIFPVNMELTLRGIFEADDAFMNRSVFFNREYLVQSLPEGRRGEVGTFVTLAAAPGDVPHIEAAVDDQFRNATVQTKTETQSAFGLSFLAFLGNVKLILLGVCAAVTFTVMLVSANTIAMSVRERVREVGVLKTLGYTSGTILGIILGEAVTISLVGALLGLGLATLMTGLVRSLPTFNAQLETLSIQPSVALLCLVVAAMIGLVSAFVPAFNATRISIVAALRSDE